MTSAGVSGAAIVLMPRRFLCLQVTSNSAAQLGAPEAVALAAEETRGTRSFLAHPRVSCEPRRSVLVTLGSSGPTAQPTFSANKSPIQESIWSRSDLVRQNIAKCASRLSTTRNLLFGMSFCSASQSAGGKNISRENGTT